MGDKPVPMLMRRNFEYSLAHCVKSIYGLNQKDMKIFKVKYAPNFSFEKIHQQSKEIQWPVIED